LTGGFSVAEGIGFTEGDVGRSDSFDEAERDDDEDAF
jgi:hypothetical protein